jgi:hypothetical protein
VNNQKWLVIMAWMGLLLLPPLLINVWLLLPGALEVAQTGICPPAPPDIPEYPCTPADYVLRMTLGPWTLPLQLLMLFGWIGVVVPTGAGLYFLVRRLVHRSEPADTGSHPPSKPPRINHGGGPGWF